MAWSAFPTLVDGQVWTGAHTQLVQANFNETAPAKATTAGSHFAGTGANSIAERILQAAVVLTTETTTSTSYTNLTTTGGQVTATTGAKALIAYHCRQQTSIANTNVWTSVTVGAPSSIAASDNWALSMDLTGSQFYHGVTYIEPNLTPGTQTFTMQYRVSSTNTGTFSTRRINVVPF